MDIEQAINIAKGCVMASFMDRETKQAVIEALKRHMPMKPKIDGEFGLCKTCNYVFNSELVSEYCVKHCPNCGQKIDWSEE